MPTTRIEIANPLPSQWRYMAADKAERAIRRGKGRRLTDGRLFLFHLDTDAEARARAEQERINGEIASRTGLATRQQRKGLGICGDPDSMIRAGNGGEGAWHWAHSVHRTKQGSSQHAPCQS